MTILVIGSRGSLGQHVCAQLAARGLTARTMSRRDGQDARDPDAVTRAAAGVDGRGLPPTGSDAEWRRGVDGRGLPPTGSDAEWRRGVDGRGLPPAGSDAEWRRGVDGRGLPPTGSDAEWRRGVVDAIVDCAGASVAVGLGHGWRGYRAVDTAIGLAAVEAARRTNARLVYVGAYHAAPLRAGAYVDAHERVFAAMGDIDGTIVRATGFYSAFAALLPLARRGVLIDIGGGRTRTNPVAEADVARAVVGAIVRGGPREVAIGGPEVMTRRELFEQVAARAGRRVRIARVPAWLGSLGAAMMRLVHPRIGQFAQFATALARHDNIAPAVGTITLADYLGELVAPAA